MTTFLTPGFGGLGSHGSSVETRALRESTLAGKSFVNKDFVKNMAFLNQTVDTHTAFLQKMQKGVDDANENILEQIQGFAGDLFILFAGLTPTGIELGDLKYVLQGLGALLGINPDTPFPMNLFEAALHLFETYIIPLDQFEDVIFDFILGWAEQFGLSPEFIQAISDLLDAIFALGHSFFELFQAISDALGIFGFLDFTSINGLGDIWDTLVDLIDGLAIGPLKPVLSMLGDLGIPFIQALTYIIETVSSFLDPLGSISGGQISELGSNVIPPASSQTTVWGVGGDESNAWVYDESEKAFTTLGTGVPKRMVMQKTLTATPTKVLVAKAQLKWSGIPAGYNIFGISLIWFQGTDEISQTDINIANGHGSNGGYTEVSQEITVPNNVDGFKLGMRVGSGVNSGRVWVKDPSVQLKGLVQQNQVNGLLGSLAALIPFNIFNSVLGITNGDAGPLDIIGWFTNIPSMVASFFQGGTSPFGVVGGLVNGFVNLLFQPFFGHPTSVAGDGVWVTDETTQYNGANSVKTTANGSVRKLIGSPIAVVTSQQFSLQASAKWTGLAGSGNPIQLMLKTNLGESLLYSIPFSAAGDFASNTMVVTYVVPPGVTQIALEFVVDASATAGTVWFSAPSASPVPVPAVITEAIRPSNIFGTLLGTVTGGLGIGTPTALGTFQDFGMMFFNLLAGGSGFFSGTGLFNTSDVLGVVQQGIQTTLYVAQNFASAALSPVMAGVKLVIQNLQLWGTYALQMASRFAGAAVTAIDSVITTFLSWFNHQTWAQWIF